MKQPLNIGLIGIGGWGINHISTLRTLHGAGLARFVAVADPTAARFPALVQGLKAEGVACHDDHKDLLALAELDAVVICTPIPLHAAQTVAAFEAGKHVYLEKPPCVTLAQLNAMEAARVKAGVLCAVGFQKQAEPSYRYLRQLLDAGNLGRLTHIWAGVRWMRDDAYYNRAAWAGRLSLDGEPVLDGPATNALSHIVQAGLALTGRPARVRGRLRHARPIESYDASYIEVDSETGVNARFMMGHATAQNNETVLYLRGTGGEAAFNWNFDVAVASHGRQPVALAFPCHEMTGIMLDFLMAVQEGRSLAAALADTRPLVQGLNGALQSGGLPDDFPAELVQTVNTGSESQLYTVQGLDEEMDALVADPAHTPSLLEPGPWIDAEDIATELPGA